MSAPLRVHLLWLRPGEKFRLAEGGPEYELDQLPGARPDDEPRLVVKTPDGRTVPTREIASENGGSYFVLPISFPRMNPAPEGGGR